MKKKDKTLSVYIIILYFFIYIILVLNHNNIATIILKPVATLLAFCSLKFFLVMPKEQKRTSQTICLAFFLWVIVDVISAFSEILALKYNLNMDVIYNIEMILYVIIRIYILIATWELYHYMTRKANKFRIIADILTIVICVSVEAWLIFCKGKTTKIMDENMGLLQQADIKTIFSFIYLLISLMILGTLLIAWFQCQKTAMTLGQRFIMLGIAGISMVDIAVALNNHLLRGNYFIDISYQICILIIAIGSIFYEKYFWNPFQVTETSKVEEVGSWKNAFYLVTYPLLAISIVGFQLTILIYMMIIAFYITSCLYVKQIEVTDKLLEEEKKYSEKLKLYLNVIEQAPLSIIITNTDADIQYVNSFFSKVSGYSLEEVRGKNPRILKSEHTPKSTYELLWSDLCNGEKWNGEFTNINKSGEEFEENAIIVPIKDESGRTTNYVAIKENISETKRIRNQLTNQNYFTSQLLDNIPSAIFYVSVNDIFLGANAECKRIYGIEDDKIIGTKFSDAKWMNAEKYQNFIQMKEETIHNDVPSVRQIKRQITEGKEATILYSISPFYLADGSVGGFLGVMTDISELKQKEKDLEKALKQANAATDAKSHFLANMSHEIRTPMNAVIGMSYLALKSKLDTKQRDYVNKIHSAATSLLGIINDILDFSKIESGKMELEVVDFDLDVVVTNSIGLLAEKANEKRLEFLYHLPTDLPRNLQGDPLRLGQIITNLVSNAVKFTESGEVVIDIVAQERQGNNICLEFSVKDTGIGISSDNQKKLFEAFMQSDSSTTRQFGGTGLGLAISQKIVEMMKGKIWVESEYGKGSKFVFTAWFTIKNEERLVERIFTKDIRGLNVLIVDDNSAAREILQEYLNAMGFKTDIVSSGEDALYVLLKNDKKNPYQVVFIDWQMPEMDGIQTIRKMNHLELLEHMPFVVLVTAYDKSEMIQLSEGVKIDSFLSKPISQSTLYDTIVNMEKMNQGYKIEDDLIFEDDYHIAGLRVLLTEDNEINQQIAIELLSGQGVIVDVASNGFEAIDKVAKSMENEKYDIILMDLQMPQKDGFEATVEIRKITSDIPIVAMTARTMEEEKEKCYQVGMNDHIAKPIDPDLLFSTIKKWISEKKSKELKSNEGGREHNVIELDDVLVIAGIDTKSGLKRVAYNKQLYFQLLNNFVLNQVNTLEEIEEALRIGNYESVEQLAHRLRGVSGNIGAITIQQICTDLEKTAETTKDVIKMQNLVKRLQKEMQTATKSIQEKASIEENKNNYKETKGSLEEKVKDLLLLLDDGDSDAIDSFESIKNRLKEKMPHKDFEATEMHIRNYEFEEAKVIIEDKLL